MLDVKVYLSHSLISDELSLKDKNVIVIDVLRATSSMTVALSNEAREIVPADSVSTAARIGKGAGNSLLCGERDGKMVEGFNLGNSPAEYAVDVVKEKSLIYSTTNGSVSIVKAKHSKNCILASFLNISAVTEFFAKLNEDFIIICSGKLNNFCMEDAVCAGFLLNKLTKALGSDFFEPEDPETIAMDMSKYYLGNTINVSDKKVEDMLGATHHGRYLKSMGLENDLRICSKIDSIPYLPLYNGGIIKLKEVIDSENSNKLKLKKINLNAGKEENDTVKNA